MVFSPICFFMDRETCNEFNGNVFGWEKELNLNFGGNTWIKKKKNSLMDLVTIWFILFIYFCKCLIQKHLQFAERQCMDRSGVYTHVQLLQFTALCLDSALELPMYSFFLLIWELFFFFLQNLLRYISMCVCSCHMKDVIPSCIGCNQYS